MLAYGDCAWRLRMAVHSTAPDLIPFVLEISTELSTLKKMEFEFEGLKGKIVMVEGKTSISFPNLATEEEAARAKIFCEAFCLGLRGQEDKECKFVH